MREQLASRQRRLAYEKAVYLYTMALEYGDIHTITTILQEAMQDQVLEQMILEVHDVYKREEFTALTPQNEQFTTLPPPPHIALPSIPSTMRRHRFSILIQTLAAVLVVAALLGSILILFSPRASRYGGSGSPLTLRPITIGLSASLTGVLASDGKDLIRGYQLWADSVNENGGLLGHPIQLIILDDMSDQVVALRDYIKLINDDHVDLVVGPLGYNTFSAGRIADRFGYAFVDGAEPSANTFQLGLHNIFSVSFSTENSLTSIARFLLSLNRDIRPMTVAYATADDPSTKPQLDYAKQLLERGGIKTTYYSEYPDETTDFNQIAVNIIQQHPDIVILGTIGVNDSKYFINMFRQQHFNPKALITTAGPDHGSNFINAIGLQSTEGIFAPNSGWFPNANTYQNSQFVKDYLHKYGGTPEDISSVTMQAYSVGQVLEQAIKKIHSFANVMLIQELRADTFNSLQGSVKFGIHGQNILAVSYLYQWQRGQFIPVLPSPGTQTNPEFPKLPWP